MPENYNHLMLESAIRRLIITATFNTAAYLPRLIDALKSQSDSDFEWIFDDGGSSDEIFAIVHDAAKTLDVKSEFMTHSTKSPCSSMSLCQQEAI